MAGRFDRRTLIAGGFAAAASASAARAQTPEQTAAARAAAARYGSPTYAQPPASAYTPPASDGPPDYPPPPPPRDEAPSNAADDRRDPAYDAERRRDLATPPAPDAPLYPARPAAETYSQNEIVRGASNFLGVAAETVGGAVERVFREHGQPTGYIAGEELAAAVVGGLRFGKGVLYMKNRAPQTVYWQGPSVGWDFGLNGSRSFTLCYNLQYGDAIYRRFPGVEGSAYVIGGLGVNYQKADDITLAPIRAGVGLRLGANVGYLSYSRRRNWIPF